MIKYKLIKSKEFKKAVKKLNQKDIDLLIEVLDKLINNQTPEPKHKDHKLKGKYKDLRECHIKPDLLLIYQKLEKELILIAINIGSHSDLF